MGLSGSTTEEKIWSNMTSQSRNKIRKAKKSGLKIYCSRNPEIIETFMEIYEETMKKDNANEYYYFPKEFYESILEDLKYNALWFYAKLNEEIVAISIFLFKNKKMHYHLSASKQNYQHLAPTNLLLYEAAIWGSENGYEILHLGGGLGAKEDSLYKFKKAFNRNEDCEFWIGKRVFNENMYRKLVEIRKESEDNFDIRNTFFPLYRS